MSEEFGRENAERLSRALAALLNRLTRLAREDSELRDLLGCVGRSLLVLAETDRSSQTDAGPPDTAAEPAAMSQTSADSGDAALHASVYAVADRLDVLETPIEIGIPKDPELYDEIADCFDVCGDAVALLRVVVDDADASEAFLERAMDLAAEGQSMLRANLTAFGDVKDFDQKGLFQWLRQKASEEQILIQRHMRRDDAADLSQLNTLNERLQALEAELRQRREQKSSRRNYINKIRYHIKQITQKPEQNHERDWMTIASALERLVTDGIPPSNVELRDLLLPFVDVMPVEAAKNPMMQRVLLEIDRFLASRPTGAEAGPKAQPTEAVAAVAQRLTGKSILMIGGEIRIHAKRALEEAFNLHELVWMKTREHNTRIDFDPDVSRPDVVVVLLAIRWSRHSYSEVETSCEKYNKPLVRLPAGYHPSQVADQILKQCSEQLCGQG